MKEWIIEWYDNITPNLRKRWKQYPKFSYLKKNNAIRSKDALDKLNRKKYKWRVREILIEKQLEEFFE